MVLPYMYDAIIQEIERHDLYGRIIQKRHLDCWPLYDITIQQSFPLQISRDDDVIWLYGIVLYGRIIHNLFRHHPRKKKVGNGFGV